MFYVKLSGITYSTIIVLWLQVHTTDEISLSAGSTLSSSKLNKQQPVTFQYEKVVRSQTQTVFTVHTSW
jgi:hypothetical protein